VKSQLTDKSWIEAFDPRRVDPALIEKYETAGPRYTSYPTAPQFYDLTEREILPVWRASNTAGNPAGLSLYVHIPFCRTLCFFCGCHTYIRKTEEDAEVYIVALIEEILRAAQNFDCSRPLRSIALGGGTPNFISVGQLNSLMTAIRTGFAVAVDAEISVEIDPRTITPEKLDAFIANGFNRFSFGVQDFNEQVIKAVGREQGPMQVERAISYLREHGIEQINFDMIYGLPGQNLDVVKQSVQTALQMRPTRLAYYNYAHVPWLKPQQKKLERLGLPTAEQKTGMFGHVFESLTASGYVPIGMDHFALPEDSLAQALVERKLNRNFMGYTTYRGNDLLAFGASAISGVAGSYSQNEKSLPEYIKAIDSGELPIVRGFVMSDDDIIRREIILELFCNFRLDYETLEKRFDIRFGQYFAEELELLKEYADDGLLAVDEGAIEVSPTGRFFVRNICMTFDRYLESAPEQQRYSKTI
jgi:oxygen-independent coproporphyrinogen III oxidase